MLLFLGCTVSTPGYITPPLLVSLGLYRDYVGPPETVSFDFYLHLEPTLELTSVRVKLYHPTRMWDLGTVTPRQMMSGVYRVTLQVPFSVIQDVATRCGFPVGLSPLEMPYQVTAQVFGGLPVVRLSSFVREEDREKPVLGIVTFNGGFGSVGVFKLSYSGPFKADLGISVFRHDFEPLILPLFSHVRGVGEIVAQCIDCVLDAEPALSATIVHAYYTVLDFDAPVKLRLYLELYNNGNIIGSIEDHIYPIFAWFKIPRLLGDRLYEPGIVAVAPASKSIL